MKLDFIPLDRLSVSKANMRHAKRPPDVSDILPTVRSRGVLQPLLVRPSGTPSGDGAQGYEIVAGRRRFHAARLVADERHANDNGPDRSGPDPDDLLPCAILDVGDDADAVEASMIENMARQDADEVSQWESFTRLVREGRSVAEIATTFGVPDLAITRVLALGNLLPAIRNLYRSEQIDRTTVRHLTMATKSQQQAWLALAEDRNAHAPTGQQLKAWLCGGQSIALGHALFDVEASGLATIADLFGEDRYFADSAAFWEAQNAAIEARRAAFVADGWADAVIVPPSQHFATWEYEKTAKRRGGRVYLDVRGTGEVVVHEGYLSTKEARRQARGEGEATPARPARPEITATMQTYVDLHRHAAVRAAMMGHHALALRLMAAHAITGSPLWTVRPEPQTARNDAVRDSIDNSPGEAAFDERRRAILAVLGFDPEMPTVSGGTGHDDHLVALFARLLDLPDAVVMEIVALVMGETLAAGSAAVDAVATEIGVDMAHYWSADAAFFDLVRDREVLTSIVGEVAGATIAEDNAKEKAKTLKTIVRDHLCGTNGRTKVEGWVPRWMAFPPSAYTTRGGVPSVAAHARAAEARERGRTMEGAADETETSDPEVSDTRVGRSLADIDADADAENGTESIEDEEHKMPQALAA